MAQLKKLVTSKVIDMLKKLAEEDETKYNQFWEAYARFIKQGVAIEQAEPEALHSLLRFHTTKFPDQWHSLEAYVERMQPGQDQIYYIIGDDEHSILYSPHLEVVKRFEYEVLLMTDPVDAFLLMGLNKYKDHTLANVATSDLKLPEGDEKPTDQELPETDYSGLVERFKTQLGERVTEVRMTGRLSDSPARLVDPEGVLNQEMQRVYRMLNREFDAPKKVLELNPRHPILVRLNTLPADSPLNALITEQVYEDALLIEGLHPDPASMIARIQKLMEAALV
jgi:molecular chaperone HtpG